MKRAVTIDASARGSPNTPQYSRLKRCKSAFVNLKRLGGAVTASPKMRPLPDCFPGDPSGVGWAVGEEINHSSRWWQQLSNPSPAVTPPSGGVIGVGGPGRSFAIGSRCATTSPSSSLSPYRSSSAFYPHRGSMSLRGAGRRLFVSSENTQDQPRNTGSSGVGSGADGGSSYRGRCTRIMGSRRKTISPALSFSPVPEKGAISSTGDDDRVESTRCSCLQLHGLQDPMAGASRIAGSAPTDVDVGCCGDSPIERDVEDHMSGCWTGPGSPAFSVVGFDLAEDEEDEARSGNACSSSYLSPNTFEPQPAMRPMGNASRQESSAEVADEHAVEAWSPAWSQTAMDSKSQFTVGNTPSGDDPASPILLLRLQRRFEEMVLVSNVAT